MREGAESRSDSASETLSAGLMLRRCLTPATSRVQHRFSHACLLMISRLSSEIPWTCFHRFPLLDGAPLQARWSGQKTDSVDNHGGRKRLDPNLSAQENSDRVLGFELKGAQVGPLISLRRVAYLWAWRLRLGGCRMQGSRCRRCRMSVASGCRRFRGGDGGT